MSKDREKVLVACIGNIFMGDDAFGCEVAKLLAARGVPDSVKLVDFGIRSFDLAYALMDGYETTIFVDAAPRGGSPGTLYLIEPDREEIDAIEEGMAFEPHNMDPLKVLSMVRTLGGRIKRIFVVGCEPAYTGDDEGHMGLSEPVSASLEKAVEMIGDLIERSLGENEAVAAAQ